MCESKSKIFTGSKRVIFKKPTPQPFKPQYLHTNSPNWFLYISLKNELREFVKRSRYFYLGDHFIKSHNLFVDNVWILLGENWSWSLLGLTGLSTVFAYYMLWKDSVFSASINLLAWTLKTAQCAIRFSNIQYRFLPVEFAGTSICLKEVKIYDSAFGSLANQSKIHFSLKSLTKPTGSYKWS